MKAVNGALKYTSALVTILAVSSVQAKPKAMSSGEIAELKNQISVLMKRVEELEASQKSKDAPAQDGVKSGLSTVGIDQKLPAPQSPTVVSSSDKVKVTVGGQVSRAVTFIDNKKNTRIHHVDNDISPSRVFMKGQGKINDETTANALVEVQIENNSTDTTDVSTREESNSSSISARHVDFNLDNKKFGTVFMGLGSTASDGTTENDLSGTYIATGASGIEQVAGGATFVNTKTNAVGPKINQVHTGMDGLSRRNRIRYDTPDFAGFKLGTSHVSSDAWDGALKYSGDISGTKIQGGVGVAKRATGTGGTNIRQVSGSLSVRIPAGFSVTVASGQQNSRAKGRKNATMFYGKLGYETKIFDLGTTAFSIDTSEARNISATVNQTGAMRSYGAAIVQNIDKIATETYLTARTHKMNVTNMTYKDIVVVMLGARIKL